MFTVYLAWLVLTLSQNVMGGRVAFITAIYGTYERSTKPFAPQRDADFICFTDRPVANEAGWILDSNPYHLNDTHTGYRNSFNNNDHPFNIAKYYKENFHRIPRMGVYDYVVWLDGTVQVTQPDISVAIQHMNFDLLVYEHESSGATLRDELARSLEQDKYTQTKWLRAPQSRQDCEAQVKTYYAAGYRDAYWTVRNMRGMWITCFIVFPMRKPKTSEFLDAWWMENLIFSTQDQISFPYLLWRMDMFPRQPPRNPGDRSHFYTAWYKKHDHGH